MVMFSLSIEDLRKGPRTLEFEVSPQELDLTGDEFTFEKEVRGRIEFKLRGRDVEGNGRIEALAVTLCARCLGPVTCELDVAVDEMWLWRDSARPESPKSLSEDIIASFYEGDELDVRETLREAILARLPEFPHCSPDCKGLCPRCGANLNRERCRCKPGERPRDSGSEWKRALALLKKKD